MDFNLCPKCGYIQYCSCNNCKKHLPQDALAQVYISASDMFACANCGFTESQSWWLDYEWDIAVEGGRIERPPDYGIFVDWDGIEINYI